LEVNFRQVFKSLSTEYDLRHYRGGAVFASESGKGFGAAFKEVKMKKIIVSFLLFSSITSHAAVNCKQMYGDGADVNLAVSIENLIILEQVGYEKEDEVRLPFLKKEDGFIPYRKVTLKGFDDAPEETVSAYIMGGQDIYMIGVSTLLNSEGKNIGGLFGYGDGSSRLGITIYGRARNVLQCK
jgi:hypothetical protein